MSEERKGKRIEQWDEVAGVTTVVEKEKTDTIEDVGAGPSISRHYLRGVEDQVEQNDNNFDGIINNTPQETVAEKEQRTSIAEKLRTAKPKEEPKRPPLYCHERAID